VTLCNRLVFKIIIPTGVLKSLERALRGQCADLRTMRLKPLRWDGLVRM